MTSKRSEPLIRLCIVSLHSYPLFNPGCESPFGGSEVRASLIARELAKSGRFDVHVVVFDHDQPRVERRAGVTIHAWPDFRCRWPVYSAAFPAEPATGRPAARRLWGAGVRRVWARVVRRASVMGRRVARLGDRLKRRRRHDYRVVGRIGSHQVRYESIALFDAIDADVYMMLGNSVQAAELAFFCRARGKPYVFVSASDRDYHPDHVEKPNELGAFGLPGHVAAFAIRNACGHIVQSQHQADLLARVYHRPAVVVRSPVDVTPHVARPARPDTILWVGKSNWVKRPELALQLARALPEFSFMMVMTLADEKTFDECRTAGTALPNVAFRDYVPFHEVETYFAAARLLVNTSVFEGFPNTFLQAAKYGVPVVSYEVDPGGMLSQHGCGRLGDRDPVRMTSHVRALMTTPTLYAQVSARCREYVRTHHDKDRIGREYARLLEGFARGERGPGQSGRLKVRTRNTAICPRVTGELGQ